MLSSIGVPGLNGFVGEFLILVGTFASARWWAVASTAGVILAALYLLWAYQRVFHGTPEGEENERIRDLDGREGLAVLALLVPIVFLGVYPKPVLDRIEPSVDRLLAHVEANVDGFREVEGPEPAGNGPEDLSRVAAEAAEHGEGGEHGEEADHAEDGEGEGGADGAGESHEEEGR
jgi:NADH-quinone oxidoreductase subunit M